MRNHIPFRDRIRLRCRVRRNDFPTSEIDPPDNRDALRRSIQSNRKSRASNALTGKIRAICGVRERKNSQNLPVATSRPCYQIVNFISASAARPHHRLSRLGFRINKTPGNDGQAKNTDKVQAPHKTKIDGCGPQTANDACSAPRAANDELHLSLFRSGRRAPHLQAKTAGAAADQFNNAAARVAAIALVHQQLHRYGDVGTVTLDRYLIDLCQAITSASSSPDRAWSLVVDADPLIISTDVAVPLALVVNELVTNAIQHSKPIGESGTLHVLLKCHPDTFTISVSDPGGGPAAAQSSGLGTRITPVERL